MVETGSGAGAGAEGLWEEGVLGPLGFEQGHWGAMGAEEYMLCHHLRVYVQEAMQQLVAEDAPGNGAGCLHRYFRTVALGEHVLGKGFQYLTASPHNTFCFIGHCRDASTGVSAGTAFKLQDCLAFLQLLCGDIPRKLIGIAHRVAWHTAQLARLTPAGGPASEESARAALLGYSPDLPASLAIFLKVFEICLIYRVLIQFTENHVLLKAESLDEGAVKAKLKAAVRSSSWPAPPLKSIFAAIKSVGSSAQAVQLSNDDRMILFLSFLVQDDALLEHLRVHVRIQDINKKGALQALAVPKKGRKS